MIIIINKPCPLVQYDNFARIDRNGCSIEICLHFHFVRAESKLNLYRTCVHVNF